MPINKIVIDCDSTLYKFPLLEYISKVTKTDFDDKDMAKWNWWRDKGVEDKLIWSFIDFIHVNQESYEPFPEAVEFLKRYAGKVHITVATHRKPKFMIPLISWLKNNKVPYDAVYCQKSGKEKLFDKDTLVIDDKAYTLQAALKSNAIAATIEYPWNAKMLARNPVIVRANDWKTLGAYLDDVVEVFGNV